MADEYDGRVVIDTELDTDGFKKGSDKLIDALKGVETKINNLGDAAARAFEEPQKLEIKAEAPKPEEIREGLEEAVEAAEEELPPVQPHLDSAALDKEAGAMERKLSGITNEIYRMVSASAQGFRSSGAVLAFDNQLGKAQDRIADARAELEAFAEQEIPTDKYAEVSKKIEDTTAQSDKLYDKLAQLQSMGVDESSKSWQKLIAQIEKADNLLSIYEDEAETLRIDGEAFIDPKTTDQYHAMVEELQAAEAALETNVGLIRQEEIEQARMAVLVAQEKVAHASNFVERQLAIRQLEKAQNELARVAEKSVTPAPDPNAVSAWDKFGKIISTLGGGVLSAGKRLGSIAKTVASLTKKVTSSIGGTLGKLRGASGIDGLTKKLTGLKGMLVSRIKRTFVSTLFNEISTSFKELAKFDTRFDQAISNMKNRTAELAANIMATFGPLIQQIEPIVTGIIEKASEAVVKINAALAAIRGETTMTIAAKRTESYAASLNDAASSAKKAKTAQDKLNQTLTSYDEIHKLSDNNAAAAAETATDEASAPVYKTVEVEPVLSGMDEAVRGLITRMKDAVRRGDWGGVGDALADGFNLGVTALDEAIIKARDRVITGAHNIAEALNGLTAGFDAYALGKTLADGLELGLDTAYEFLTTYDFGVLGSKIADGINGLGNNLNAEKVGRTIASAVNAAIDFAFELISGIDWDRLGEKIGTAFNRLVHDIDWTKLAHTVGEGFKGVLNGIASFIETADWEQVGRTIITVLAEIDWPGIAKAMWRLLGAAIGGIAGLIKGAFAEIIERSSNWGEHLFDDYGSEFNAAGEQVSKGVWKGITGMFENCWKTVKDNILNPLLSGFKKAFGISSPAKKMNPTGEYIAQGVLEGMTSIFSNVTSWVTTNVLEPFKRGFNTAFNVVGDKAQAMLANGKSIANGIKSGIETGWGTVTTILSQKADSIKGFFTSEEFKGLGTKVIEGIGAGVGDDGTYQNSIGGKLVALAEKVSGSINVDGVKQVGKNILHILGWGLDDDATYNDTIGKSINDMTKEGGAISDSVNADGLRQIGRNMAWLINDGLDEYLHSTDSSELDGFAAEWVKQSRYNAGTWGASLKYDVSEIGQATKEVNKTTDGIDTVADKLAAIAEIFENIRRTFSGMTVPTPAIVTGNFAPAGTAVTTVDGASNAEIKQLLQRFLDRAEELEERIAGRPIRLESHVEINRRELGLAVAEYNQNNTNISNGNGGAW